MSSSVDSARRANNAEIERAREIAIAMKSMDGPLVPILHALQAEFGYIDTALEPVVADVLNITRAEVHGVVTFYRDFRRAPAARQHLALCRSEACQSMGGEALVARAEARLGIACGAATPDGRVQLDAVYCLGLCSVAPSAMIDGRVMGRLNEGRLDALLAEVSR